MPRYGNRAGRRTAGRSLDRSSDIGIPGSALPTPIRGAARPRAWESATGKRRRGPLWSPRPRGTGPHSPGSRRLFADGGCGVDGRHVSHARGNCLSAHTPTVAHDDRRRCHWRSVLNSRSLPVILCERGLGSCGGSGLHRVLYPGLSLLTKTRRPLDLAAPPTGSEGLTSTWPGKTRLRVTGGHGILEPGVIASTFHRNACKEGMRLGGRGQIQHPGRAYVTAVAVDDIPGLIQPVRDNAALPS